MHTRATDPRAASQDANSLICRNIRAFHFRIMVQALQAWWGTIRATWPLELGCFTVSPEPKRPRKNREMNHDFVVPEILPELGWNRRISVFFTSSVLLSALSHLLLSFALIWFQSQAIKDSGVMLFRSPPLIIVDYIDFAHDGTTEICRSLTAGELQESNFGGQLHIETPNVTSGMENSLLRIEETIEAYNILTCSWGSTCDKLHSAPAKSDHVRFVCLYSLSHV